MINRDLLIFKIVQSKLNYIVKGLKSKKLHRKSSLQSISYQFSSLILHQNYSKPNPLSPNILFPITTTIKLSPRT